MQTAQTPRQDGRADDELRPVEISLNAQKFAEGSALITVGETRVLCAATIEDRVPPWLRGKGQGWVTAEYAMLPRATSERNSRESVKGKIGGRTHEIQRLIGRSLRSVVDLKKLGERSIIVDCDVIQADGGTRTAAITGAWVALWLALRTLCDPKDASWPIIEGLAAVSVGIIDGGARLDLPYEEDSRADVDMNIIMTEGGKFVELQATAEGQCFDHEALMRMIELGHKGITELFETQRAAIHGI